MLQSQLAKISFDEIYKRRARETRVAGTLGTREEEMIHYQHEEITREVILSAIQVHKTLGPGLLESAYKACLLLELQDRGLRCKQELIVPIIYNNHRIDCGFRIDLLVDEKVVVELKAIE